MRTLLQKTVRILVKDILITLGSFKVDWKASYSRVSSYLDYHSVQHALQDTYDYREKSINTLLRRAFFGGNKNILKNIYFSSYVITI